MSDHFIKNIEIKNFKCFKDFKAEGFGRVNLIGGKNNVGKSTFLEALYINTNTDQTKFFLNALLKIAMKRDNFFLANSAKSGISFLKTIFYLKSIVSQRYKTNVLSYINTNKNQINFNFREDIVGLKIEYSINQENKDSVNISLNDIKSLFFDSELVTNPKVHFLRPMGLSNYNINKFYVNIQKLEKETQLNEKLNLFDKSIQKFKILDGEPQVLSNEDYISVTQLGDGIKKLINIFIAIYSAKDGTLFLDELDSGMHYTMIDELWEIILTISKEQNVQVFATTHSKECIESYARVAKKLEDEEITFIELGKNKEDELKAMVYSYDWFIDEVEQNHEVRGW